MAAKMEQTEKYLHPEKIAFAIYDVKLINHKSRGNPRYLGGILFDCKKCSTIWGKQSALPSYCRQRTHSSLMGEFFRPFLNQYFYRIYLKFEELLPALSCAKLSNLIIEKDRDR